MFLYLDKFIIDYKDPSRIINQNILLMSSNQSHHKTYILLESKENKTKFHNTIDSAVHLVISLLVKNKISHGSN